MSDSEMKDAGGMPDFGKLAATAFDPLNRTKNSWGSTTGDCLCRECLADDEGTEVACPRCNGHGFLKHTFADCPECKGTGVLIAR